MCKCKQGYMCPACVDKLNSLAATIQRLREQYAVAKKPEQQFKLALWMEMVTASVRQTEAKSRAA